MIYPLSLGAHRVGYSEYPIEYAAEILSDVPKCNWWDDGDEIWYGWMHMIMLF
jgi:hypothetical protein